MAFKSFVRTFPTVMDYRFWLVKADVKVVSVVVFNEELVVTYMLH
jgi:hypothetical protein